MNLDDLNKRFEYRADGLDNWHIMQGNPLRGDCDDFAATALYVLTGSMLRWWWAVLTFQAVFWLVLDANGQRHVALWVKGRGWICNQYPAFGSLQHRKRWPFLLPLVVYKMALGKMLA